SPVARTVADPGHCSILLVEDDISLRTSLREFLKDNGFSTFTSGTMRESAEMLRTLRPPLCLLDVNLPDGSGLDLLRAVVREQLPIKVIVMSAFPVDHLRPHYPPGTLVEWLSKPVSPVQLLEAVQQVMAEVEDAPVH